MSPKNKLKDWWRRTTADDKSVRSFFARSFIGAFLLTTLLALVITVVVQLRGSIQTLGSDVGFYFQWWSISLPIVTLICGYYFSDPNSASRDAKDKGELAVMIGLSYFVVHCVALVAGVSGIIEVGVYEYITRLWTIIVGGIAGYILGYYFRIGE